MAIREGEIARARAQDLSQEPQRRLVRIMSVVENDDERDSASARDEKVERSTQVLPSFRQQLILGLGIGTQAGQADGPSHFLQEVADRGAGRAGVHELEAPGDEGSPGDQVHGDFRE